MNMNPRSREYFDKVEQTLEKIPWRRKERKAFHAGGEESLQLLEELMELGSETPWQADIDDCIFWTGKFYVGDEDSVGHTWCTYGEGSSDGPTMSSVKAAANAALCAEAVSILPALIAEIRRLREVKT